MTDQTNPQWNEWDNEARAELVDSLTGDRTLSMSPQHPAALDMRESVEELRRDFTERFGREHGPEDPLFFASSDDVPTAMSAEAAYAEYGVTAVGDFTIC